MENMHTDVRVERVRGLKQHLSLSCVIGCYVYGAHLAKFFAWSFLLHFLIFVFTLTAMSLL